MSEHPIQGVPEFHLGDRLNKALEVGGVSNQEMAAYLGVSRNTVGNYIALRTPVSLGTMRLWAMRTGVRLDWLRYGKSAPSPGGPEALNGELPRLDSNQEPAGNRVRVLAAAA